MSEQDGEHRPPLNPGLAAATLPDHSGIAATSTLTPLPQDDETDPELRDDELRAEIELVSELVLAASASDAPLSPAEIDRALGLR